jgi:alkane 1-monooxygenase
VIPLSVLLSAVGASFGTLGAFGTVLLGFAVLPFADHWIGTDAWSPDAGQEKALKAERAFSFVLYLYLPVQIAMVAGGGIGITVAHELCHRPRPVDRRIGFALLALVCYMHFGIEHVVGHHRRVSTPDDPTSSRLGESLYRFLPRTLAGSYASAWDFEALRLKKQKKPPMGLHNRMVGFLLVQVGVALALFLLFGVVGLLFFAGQAIVAVFLLETINYVEHYGLARREIRPGTYEPVQPRHSWNADFVLSNLFLFKLQRHSDHHAHPLRPYQTLRHFDESPQLPYGYPTMVLLAMAPPVWRRVMDPLVAAAQGGAAGGR